MNPTSMFKGLVMFALSAQTTGCSDDFESRTLLSGYRVVGIQAEPPEIPADGMTTLTVEDFDDGEVRADYRWSACLSAVGDVAEFECAASSLLFDLGTTSSATLALGPTGVDFAARLAEAGLAPDATGSPNEALDILVLLESGPECTDCRTIRTIKRVRVNTGVVAANTNPVIEDFSITGALTLGGTVTLAVQTSAPESYVDALSGEERAEEYLYTWYTTAGETSPGLTFGSESETKLELPDAVQELEVVVAVRDGRGGLAVGRRSVLVE